jgi:hypothetical protein
MNEELNKELNKKKKDLADCLGYTCEDIEIKGLFHFEGDYESCIYIDNELHVVPCTKSAL